MPLAQLSAAYADDLIPGVRFGGAISNGSSILMDHLKQVRRVSVLPIREDWHATPLFEDGTAGKGQRFTEASAAWDWAVTIYPGVPVSIPTIRRRRLYAAGQK